MLNGKKVNSFLGGVIFNVYKPLEKDLLYLSYFLLIDFVENYNETCFSAAKRNSTTKCRFTT